MSTDFIDFREEFNLDHLDKEDLNIDPILQFRTWFHNAKEAGCDYPEGFTLATSDAANNISARVVLMKLIEEDGFVFFTNYNSHKAEDLDTNSLVSATFFWTKLERQVRFQAKVEKVSREVSEAYFATRPRGSQLGAWISNQSQVLEDRRELETLLANKKAEFEGKEIPTPPFWGGYKITPHNVEFWQGRPSRLHDRFSYTKEGENWTINRLWP